MRKDTRVQSVAPSFGVELSPVDARDANEIERAVTAFARAPNGGLIVTGSSLAAVHRPLVVTLAMRHRRSTPDDSLPRVAA
jgi:putative tryptophan/tyrosine transport system substrate-binding protein